MKKLIVIIVILVAGYFAFNQYIYQEKQAEFTAGDTRAVGGMVLSVDMAQVAADGPYVINISADGEPVTIAVPSMGLPLCAANSNIANVSEIKSGDDVEVRGIVGEDGSIVPCESSTHYLRVTAN